MMRTAISPREESALSTLTAREDFQTLVRSVFYKMCEESDDQRFHPIVVYGARGAALQLSLYAQGREKLADEPIPYGTWKQIGRVVTRALPNQSAHCYAAACDIAIVDDATNHWLPDTHPAWGDLAGLALDAGLESGHFWTSFQDSAHVELRNWRDLVRDGALQLVG